MRTWITPLLIALLGLSLAGCGSDSKRDKSAPKDESKKDDKSEEKKDLAKEGEPKDVAKKDGDPKKDGEKKKDPLEKPKHTPPKPLEPTGEVVMLDSVKFGGEFKADCDVASKRYEKKFVELTGRVVQITLSSDGKPRLLLEGGKTEEDFPVQCPTRDSKPWLSALPGQTVKVRGIVPAGTTAALVEQCDILEAKGIGPIPFKADNLAELYALNADRAKETYKRKSLFVEGEVAKVEVNADDDATYLTLKTEKAKPAVFLRFNEGPEAKRVLKFKVGQAVKGLGLFYYDKDAVGLNDVLVVEPAP